MKFWNGVSSKIGVNEVVKGQKQNYVINKFLGVGSFNNSYLVNDHFFLKQYTYPIEVHDGFYEFKNRLEKIYGKVNNLLFTENIIEIFEYKGYCFISRRYEKNAKTLKKFISQNPSIKDRLNLLKKIALPFFEIHQNGIVHTDLKPEQFLILEDKIILIDFDHCIDEGLNIYAPAMTNYWYSPEHIKRDISFYSDVFTFGLIVYKLLTNIHPFYEMIKKGEYEKAILNKEGYIPINKIYKNTLPKDLAKCIDSMLEPDFRNRPLSNEIYEIFVKVEI